VREEIAERGKKDRSARPGRAWYKTHGWTKESSALDTAFDA